MKDLARQAAIEMRKQGVSVVEITRELGVSRSAVCGWTRGLSKRPRRITIAQRRERNRGYGAQRYKERREKIDKIKLDRGCMDCGYEKHPAALQFDHVDPAKKSFKIAASLMKNWDDILNEISKCVVRCANCHAEKTVEDDGLRLRIGRPRATE